MSASDTPPIQIRGLTRRFGPALALAPLELEIGPGITGLLGPNGSGKSTLLRMLVGLVRPSAGAARVAGVELAGDGTAVRRRCTFSPGEIGLYGELSGREHLAWLLRGRDAEALPRARRMAEAFELPLAKRVQAYSHGMKRQLLAAAALAPRVPLRILDEPSEGLDPSKRGALLDLLEQDARAGTAILISSHHLGEVDRICGQFVFLNAGRLVSVEDARGVRERSERLVHVEYGSEAEAPGVRDALQRAAAGLPGARARLDGTRLVAELDARDPRAFLGALAERAELPPPRSIAYGQLSLAELYRDLYGVDAC
jgi:ABC-2 type transport system ATP-binding protein